MSFAHNFEPDDQSISFGPSSRLAAFPGAEPPGANRLLRAIACEVAGLAGPISAATSVINAMSALPPEFVRAETLVPSLPAEPIVYPALVERLAISDIPADLFDTIHRFYTRLGHAVRLARAFASHPTSLPFRGGVHIEVLTGAWRDLAEHAITLTEQLAETGLLDASQAHPRVGDADEALVRAADGGWPCVMEDGSVEVPGLSERRRHERYRVSWPARLRHDGAMLPVSVDDVSAGGFALSGPDQLALSAPVELELMGRMLTAHVAWSTGTRFGIRLAVPLRPGDPILLAAQGKS
jgi:hypothetical protein